MDNVISFNQKREPAEMIWVCACGCSTFEVYQGGFARCALCGSNLEKDECGGWYTPDAGSDWVGDEPIKDISGNGDVDFARKLTIKRAGEPEVCALVVIKDDGTIHVWSDPMVDSTEQAEWVVRQIERARDLVCKKQSCV